MPRYDEEETKVYAVFEGMSNEEIAEKAKLENAIKKVVKNLPLSKANIEIICEVCKGIVEEAVVDKTSRLGERLGALEKLVDDKYHEIDKRILKEQSDREKQDEAFKQKFSNAAWLVSAAIATAGVIVGLMK